jgi:hypothetical protein
MAHYDANGKFKNAEGCKMICCKAPGHMEKEVNRKVQVKKEMVKGKVKATVLIRTTENGKTYETSDVFEGTEVEVQAKIDSIEKQ